MCFVACLYTTFRTKEGVLVWVETGTWGRRRSKEEYAQQEASRMAIEHKALLFTSLGTLHNKLAKLSDVELLDDFLEEVTT